MRLAGGHRQVDGCGREKVEVGRSKRRSGGHGSAGDRGPDVEGSGVRAARYWSAVTRRWKRLLIGSCAARNRCACRGLEPLHLALSPSGGLVRVFGTVVQPLVPAVLDRWQEILLCRGIAGEFVGDHDPRRSPLPLQELAKQSLGGSCITPALNQNVEHDAVLVDGAPQPVRRPGDLDDDLIEVPLVAGSRQAPPDLVREPLAKLQRPLPHRLD